jgi:hypothetical protein
VTYEEARAEAERLRGEQELRMLDHAKRIADDFSERIGAKVEFDYEPLLKELRPCPSRGFGQR